MGIAKQYDSAQAALEAAKAAYAKACATAAQLEAEFVEAQAEITAAIAESELSKKPAGKLPDLSRIEAKHVERTAVAAGLLKRHCAAAAEELRLRQDLLQEQIGEHKKSQKTAEARIRDLERQLADARADLSRAQADQADCEKRIEEAKALESDGLDIIRGDLEQLRKLIESPFTPIDQAAALALIEEWEQPEVKWGNLQLVTLGHEPTRTTWHVIDAAILYNRNTGAVLDSVVLASRSSDGTVADLERIHYSPLAWKMRYRDGMTGRAKQWRHPRMSAYG